MSKTEKLSELIQQAASSITLASSSDLTEMEHLQQQLDQIAECVQEVLDLPSEIKEQTMEAACSAGQLAHALLEQEQDNTEETLKIISDVIVSLQGLTQQIDKGILPDQMTVCFPALPGEKSSEESQAPLDTDRTLGPESSEQENTSDQAEKAPAGEAIQSADSSVQSQGRIIDGDDVEMVRDFITESAEHIESVEAGLLDLENNPSNSEAINLVFRGFHTIKGMAGFLNLSDIQGLAHASENLLDLSRKGKLELTGGNMDVVFESVDILKAMMVALKKAISEGTPVPAFSTLDAILIKLKACAEGKTPETASVLREQEQIQTQVQDVDVESGQEPQEKTIESQTTETPSQPVQAGQKLSAEAAKQKKTATDEKIKVSTARLDNLVNMVGELVIAQSMVLQEAGGVVSQDHDLLRTVSHQGKIVRELQELSMMMRMVPIQGVFQKMARLVRDLSQKSGKKVVFNSDGEETELDRIVVDQIGDPLVHMVRNSVDHGIEAAEERIHAGKDPIGHVHLRAFHQAGSIVIEIQDDGRGLDKDKILKKAVDQGVVSSNQELSDQEIYKLIFHAGLSTAAKVTDISGRGVGMDVVRKNIEALRGKVEIDSTPGKGSLFTIRLPLTMAIIEGQIVRIGRYHYIVPIVTIESCLRPTREQITTVRGRTEMVMFQGNLVPMVRLYSLFGVKADSEIPWESSLVVVEEDGKRGCLMVDELLGQHQVVIKNLGQGIGQITGIAGGAIMGDGRINLIIDVPGLLEMAAKQ
ncbi:MAG: chemotaxis protein CheA [Sedimentisphaerales bacterium]|nr:chemotaxis protein CheA [Sedimentisphaerales bacterium]